MPLNKEALKQGIIKLQQDMKAKTEPDENYYAEQLATLIEAFVKSGEVTIAKGIALQAGTYAGVTTTEGKGTIK
ncbi:hypothetical protein [Capnocytophaga sp.]|uniref:hypothetical protein n=1 Tax=Capnocytophaga sp. TaxID=44737 RepID=UPI0026DD2E33|nr:hypothetical protein [Capnocytophaga sp.]MDO5106213.1 hypothetical protein [Capnocytophaga sp.]